MRGRDTHTLFHSLMLLNFIPFYFITQTNAPYCYFYFLLFFGYFQLLLCFLTSHHHNMTQPSCKRTVSLPPLHKVLPSSYLFFYYNYYIFLNKSPIYIIVFILLIFIKYHVFQVLTDEIYFCSSFVRSIIFCLKYPWKHQKNLVLLLLHLHPRILLE